MSNKFVWVALVAVAIIAIGGYAFPNQAAKIVAGSVSTNCQGTTTCWTSGFFSDALQVTNGIVVSAASAVNVLGGTTVLNNVIYSSAGYSNTYSTAVGTTFSVTPAQFCAGTSILIPVANTTTITITLPAASTTFTTCGGVVGSFSNQLVQNESSFAVTFATTTGQVRNTITGYSPASFMFATGTPAASITYPPILQASTTETFGGSYTSTSSIEYYLSQLSRPIGY